MHNYSGSLSTEHMQLPKEYLICVFSVLPHPGSIFFPSV